MKTVSRIITLPRSIIIMLLLGVLLSCQDSFELKEPNWEKETDLVTTDDLNILNAVLYDSFQIGKKKPCEYVILLNRTERYCSYAIRPWERMCIPDNPTVKEHDLFSRAPELSTELKKALMMRNTRFGIIKEFSPAKTVKLVNPAEIDTLQPNFWNAFYKRFPNSCGFVSFSLPGYSTNALSAAVYFSGACGALCGTSSIIELSVADGLWSVKKHHIVSMS